MTKHTPKNDKSLYKNYDVSSLATKKENKKDFQKNNGLTVDANSFVLGIANKVSKPLDGNTVIETIKACLEVGMQVVVCAEYDKEYKKIFDMFAEEYKKHFAVCEYSEENQRKMFSAVDAQLFLEYNDGSETLLELAMDYGVIAVSTEHKGLDDFDAVAEKGNAFMIKKNNLWNIFEACIRAKENFSFPYDWKNLQQSCMKS